MDLFSIGHLSSVPKFEIISPYVEAKTEHPYGSEPKKKTKNPIELEIEEVFGKYSEKAFKLLKCENSKLDPTAFNINNDSVGSKDYGIFQINDYWQGIRHQGKAEQFLFDPSINIRIAWRIFEDSGYSFNLWTCGKRLNI